MEHTHVLPHTCYHTRAGGGHRNRPRSLWLLFCVSKFKSQAFSHFSSRLLKILPISCLPQSILLTTPPGKWLRPVRVSGVVGDPPRTDSSKGTEGARRGERMGSSWEAVEWTEEGTEVLCHWHTQAHTDTHWHTQADCDVHPHSPVCSCFPCFAAYNHYSKNYWISLTPPIWSYPSVAL